MKNELLFLNSGNFETFREQQKAIGYEIISITEFIQNFDLASSVDPLCQIVDISTLAVLKDEIQYHAERLLPLISDDTIFIANRKFKEFFEYDLRYCFENFRDIVFSNDKVEESKNINDHKKVTVTHKRVVDLDDLQLQNFLTLFKDRIYGHEKFKDEFVELIQNFKIFNKLGEHKILSLFILGESGVGKTEVARAIHDCLGGKKKLAKINFGNYSSDFSLSSLIGSARGYIGSDDGEIFIRVRESDVGVLLIDEFEKSNSTLFNYFLDVLESGKMVNSMAEEIDLNGFIIVFTSNIKKEDFKQRISPELRSRFDYKGLFTALFDEDKRKFVEFRVNSVFRKFHEKFNVVLPDEAKRYIISKVEVGNFHNMRDINKTLKKIFVDYIVSTLMSTNKNLITSSNETLPN